MLKGRGPVRAQDRGSLRRQAARHQLAAGGGAGLPGLAQGAALGLQPNGE